MPGALLRSPVGLALLALLAAPAAAQELAGEVAASGWLAPERGQGQVELELALELEREVALRALARRPWEGGVGEEQLELRLDWGSWRLAGGALGSEGGLHLGWSPGRRWDPRPWLSLRLDSDLSLGAGFLAGTREGPLPGVDVYAAALALGGEAELRPWGPLRLTLGVHGSGTAAWAPPRRGALADPALPGWARRLDPGPSSALSQARCGGWAGVSLRLLGRRAGAGALGLWLSYREAWDWIHLDPLASVLAVASPWGELRPDLVPWRATRTLALSASLQRPGGDGLDLTVELRHVQGGVALEGIGQLPGWSVGLAGAARWGRWRVDLAARQLLGGRRRWEDQVGALARTRGSFGLGASLWDTPASRLELEAGLELGLEDRLGLARSGQAVRVGLRLAFGGALPRSCWPAPVWPLPPGAFPTGDPEVASGSEQAPPPGPQLQVALARPELRQRAREVLAGRDPLGWRELLEDQDVQALLAALPISAAQVEGWVEQHPRDVARLEQLAPGLVGRLRELVAARQGTDPAGAFLGGAGPGGLTLAALRPERATLHAITTRWGGAAASELALRERTDPDAGWGELLARGRAASYSGLSGLLREEGVETFSWYRLEGGRLAVVLQGRGPWSRRMHRWLTGR